MTSWGGTKLLTANILAFFNRFAHQSSIKIAFHGLLRCSYRIEVSWQLQDITNINNYQGFSVTGSLIQSWTRSAFKIALKLVAISVIMLSMLCIFTIAKKWFIIAFSFSENFLKEIYCEVTSLTPSCCSSILSMFKICLVNVALPLSNISFNRSNKWWIQLIPFLHTESIVTIVFLL